MDRFKLIPSVYLILVKDGKTLLQRRQNTGFMDGYYGLVAGHVDGGESFTEAMVREAYEESGIVLPASHLRVVHLMHRKMEDERVDIFFTTDAWEGELRLAEPHRADHLEWFHLKNLPENTIPYIREAIENVRKGIFYSEFGW